MIRRLAAALAMLLTVVAMGTLGYALIEGAAPLDALFMTVITMSTVGYREVFELSPMGRVFTMGLIFAGGGVILFSFGTFVDFLVEGHLKGLLEERRMQRNISQMKAHHVVAGLGRVGDVVARTLDEEGAQFVIVDNCEDCAVRAREQGWSIVVGDATDEAVLKEAGVQRARSLVTALDTDADNLFVTVSARALNPDLFIVARCASESTEAKLRKAGANRVLTPNVIGGRRMANMVLHPIVSDYLDLVSHGDEVEFRLEELRVPKLSPASGQTIRELQVRDLTGAYILAVHPASGGVNTNPSPETPLQGGDLLVVLGTTPQLEAFANLMAGT